MVVFLGCFRLGNPDSLKNSHVDCVFSLKSAKIILFTRFYIYISLFLEDILLREEREKHGVGEGMFTLTFTKIC